MKRNDLDLKALENADNSVLEQLSEQNILTSEEKDRMYDISRKYCDHEEAADKIVVSGVEKISGRSWQRALAFAAAFLLVVGIGCGGTVFMLKKSDIAPEKSNIQDEVKIQPQSRETTVQNAATEITLTEISTKPTTTKIKTAKAEKAITTQLTETSEITFPPFETNDSEETQLTESENPTEAAQGTLSPTPRVPDEQYWQNSPPCEFIDIYEMLNSLQYLPVTCDGLPEGYLLAPDGTTFIFNLSSHWIWRQNGIYVEEAQLTDDLIEIIRSNGYLEVTDEQRDMIYGQ